MFCDVSISKVIEILAYQFNPPPDSDHSYQRMTAIPVVSRSPDELRASSSESRCPHAVE